MSGPEDFLRRWSRRKLAESGKASPEREDLAAADERVEPKTPPSVQDAQAAASPDEPFDLASLPSLDSIDAGTDVTTFLRPGVPPELTRAALRRAWSADPAIRDFVGLVENGWDFNDPNAMPGFGPIDPSEVARLAAQMLGNWPTAKAEAAAESAENAALDESGPPALPASGPIASEPSDSAGEGDRVADARERAADAATQNKVERESGAASQSNVKTK